MHLDRADKYILLQSYFNNKILLNLELLLTADLQIHVQVQVYFPNQSVNRTEFSINQSCNTFTNKSNKHC